ncbi:MAG: enoyl-CoA hydratase/isomerase family protein [Dehalococcoidia bacterium]|nr:enoyl-CoA hydratase/isomerase family protein [Dehalococcoidia bacterium]
MDFKPTVVKQQSSGTYPPYTPTFVVPREYNDIVLEWDTETHVAVITLNRPAVQNALSPTLMEETIDALRLIEDNDDINCAMLRPAGEHFCTGGDFNAFTNKDLMTQRWYFELPPKLLQVMTGSTVPIVGLVRGNCCAFGVALAGSCDIVLASESASFFLPGGGVGFGCFTPTVGAYKSVLRKRMFELLLTSRPHSADWAHDAGLVNYVHPEEEIEQKTWEMTKLIASNAPLVVRWEKQFFYQIQDLDERHAFRYGTELITMQSLTRDGNEGQNAFLQKRKPVWEGRKGGGARGDVHSPEEEHVWKVGKEGRRK